MLIEILEKLNKKSSFLKFKTDVENGIDVGAFGLNFAQKIAFLADLKYPLLFVANNYEQAHRAQEMLETLNRKAVVLTQNLFDFVFNENSHSPAMQSYCQILTAILKEKIDVIITPNVLPQKLPSKLIYEKNIFEIKQNYKMDITHLAKMCVELGYERVAKIDSVGQFASRGDIFEIYTSAYEQPIRIDFFDDEIESIKFFDVESYHSGETTDKCLLFPNNLFNKVNLYDALAKLVKSSQKTAFEPHARNRQVEIIDRIKQTLSLNKNSALLLYLLPFFEEFNNNIIDYLSSDYVVCFEDIKVCYDAVQSLREKSKDIKELLNSGELVAEHSNVYFVEKKTFEIPHTKIGFQNLYNANRIFEPKSVFSFTPVAINGYYNMLALKDLIKRNANNTVVLLCQNNQQLKEFANEFVKDGISFNKISNFNEVEKSLNLIVSGFKESFSLPDEKLVIISCSQKGADDKVKHSKIRSAFLLPKVGEYVVHDVYGIGKCIAIERLNFTNYQKDYIIIEYAMGDKLFLPIEQASLISAYIGGNESPKMNRLGTNEFTHLKEKVQNSVREMAINLVDLYAKREKEKGVKFEPDDFLQQQFENDFKYNETPDQLSAIHDIKKDMQLGKVMDRLLCGDVGYGKTEVALRAIFKTVQAGYQVAVMVPTTILSVQHYNTFKERMAKYMINVEVLNRFKTATQTRQICQKLQEGEINVIIGTHKLLNKNVKYKKLGLLVLDEEQRFGVEHKEKIKLLKNSVNVLSMSATPIPRTLHMSMVGIRDISLITTPPQGRLPIKTIVGEFSFALLKTAVESELNRDGQVLIIYNRIDTIYNFAEKVRELFPHVDIGVAHGRMDERMLEKTIFKVFNKETKILISTTLIENGIDLPNANTMIIINADKLGLSQLYQLRGRIGRSDRESYAYLTFERDREITEDGNKRLVAMGEFSELGSGFKIAMKDLEIRGAGNVLGKEQHGHIAKVGYDMYCKLLELSVKELKGEIIHKSYEVKMEIGLDCFIPNDYIENTDDRFNLFNELSKIECWNDLQKAIDNLKEIYSYVPNEVVNLARTILLRNLCVSCNVKRVVVNAKKCLLEFDNNESALSSNMTRALDKYKNVAVLNFDNVPIIEFKFQNVKINNQITTLIDFLLCAVLNIKE